MKKKLLWVILAVTLSTQAATPNLASPPFLMPLPQQNQAAGMTAQYLTRWHYKAQPLDDAMSEKIFDHYIKSLDSEKMFFVQADIDQFAGARTTLDNAIYGQNMNLPFAIFNLYEQRFAQRYKYARELLNTGFDFSQKESYQYVRDNAPWPKNENEARELWRQRVKNDWLRLKLAGKDDKAIRETLDKRYENALNRMFKLKSEDVFQVFLDSYAMAVDPHTNYLGPKASEDFDISMRLSLIGIGAVLQERDEYTTIRELVPGGPAALSGKLNVGDRIVGVGQGEKSSPVDILGWRLDDVVALIRGEKDSTVLLDILPAEAGPDGQHKQVLIKRKKISLEEQAAKKTIIQAKVGDSTKQIGVITLPAFYQDFEAHKRGDENYKSATRDVARILAEFKKEKVDGVLIDLRNNGGGALDEAVELTSLFVGNGPVVQQRNSQGKVRVESDKDARAVWTGPMGVMINRGSASASEIFAAAIQDYGRGLIIGEPSFGKGTVQTIISLDQVAHSEQPKYGELKMTIAQFFRINGGTTQLRGVVPEISFPSFSDPKSFGESSYDNALPWSQIQPANYQPVGDLTDVLPMLQVRHEARVAKDRDYQYLVADAAEFKTLREKTEISLNEAERKKERDDQEAKLKAREKERNADKDIKHGDDDEAPVKVDDGLQANERKLSEDIAAEKARKNAKDVLQIEAANILADEVEVLKTNTKLAARVLPGLSVK